MTGALARWLAGEFDGTEAERRLRRMARAASSEERRRIASEIDALLDGHLCEPQIRDVLVYEIGCGYAFERDGYEASSWLGHIRARLRREER